MAGVTRYNSPSRVQRIGNDSVYGPGTDGNGYVNSAVTLTSDMYYNNLEVTSSGFINTNGYRLFVKGTLTLNGHIGVGSVTSGVVGEPGSNTTSKTVAGNTTSAITYRAGGQGGGSASAGITALPTYLYNDINMMSGGMFADPSSGMVAIQGGSRGLDGVDGVTAPALTNSDSWPGKAGTAGTPGGATGSTGVANPYKDTVGVPGGRGNTGADGTATGATPGLGGSKGLGGSGGAVVLVVAKTIVGSGKIISLGRSSTAGTSGTTGNPGTAGAAGSKAPDLAYHVAPHTHPNPDARTHNYHSHTTKHSDRHGHTVNPHPHYDHKGHTYQANSGHYHHGGHYHHPHNDGPHGGVHHWDGHYWHAYWQVHTASGFPHYHQKPNGHHSHYEPSGNGHHHTLVYHGSFGGHDGHVHAHFGLPHHSHTHAHHPHSSADYHHHHVAPTSVANPNGHYTGGNGGPGGAAAPAQSGTAGTHGGAGGGGAILVVTDSIAGTISYDTRAGLTSHNTAVAPSSGSAYVLINT